MIPVLRNTSVKEPKAKKDIYGQLVIKTLMVQRKFLIFIDGI
jgi:hypothetical protein